MIFGSKLKRLVDLAFSSNYLVLTNTSLGVCALIGADSIQQLSNHYFKSSKTKTKLESPSSSVDERGHEHDYNRSTGMFVGGVFAGLGGHYWYKFLDTKFPGKSVTIVSKKLFLEGLIGPPFISLFYYIVARTEGRSTIDWYNSFKETISTIILAEWFCFVPLQAVNFFLLPPKYRFLYVGIITLFYDYFLSYIFHK